MVQVLNEPYAETEPILGAASGNDDTDAMCYRKNSYAEEQAYKNITSPMKAEPLKIDNPTVALQLFSTAIRLHNIDLANQCAEILDNQMNETNVLNILSHLSICKSPIVNPNDYQPSAPPIVEIDNQHNNEDWVQMLISTLRDNCLLKIDKHADYVLKQKEILDLTYVDILTITTRDTLQVSSELLVYSAIMRWSLTECKRRELQPQYMKAVLRELVYAPRYGLMTKKDFNCRNIDGVKGPDRSGILDENEINQILKYIKKPRGELPRKLSLPRIHGNKKPKPIKSNLRVPRSKWEKWFINFLTCWTAVFD